MAAAGRWVGEEARIGTAERYKIEKVGDDSREGRDASLIGSPAIGSIVLLVVVVGHGEGIWMDE